MNVLDYRKTEATTAAAVNRMAKRGPCADHPDAKAHVTGGGLDHVRLCHRCFHWVAKVVPA